MTTGPDDNRAGSTVAGEGYGDEAYATGTHQVDAYATGAASTTGGSHVVGGVEEDKSYFENPAADRSVGDIVGDITKDLTALVRQEIELGKTEAKAEVKKLGKGAGMLAGAGIFGHLMLIALTAFLISLLHYWMDWPWAALIVTVLWGIVAAVLGLSGKKQLQTANPALPTTQQTLKEDVQWAKDQKSS